MALLQRIEYFEEPTPTMSAYADTPLPSLILREVEELNRRERALPQLNSAKARKMFVTAIATSVTLWGLLIEGANLALKMIA